MLQTLKRKLITYLTKTLLTLVDSKEIIYFNKSKQVFVDGRMLSSLEVQNLRAEIKFLEESSVWKLMNNKMDDLAKQKMFEKSIDITDMIVGKTTLWVLKSQRDIIKNIKNC
jgi:hypothetical protein